MSLVCDHELKNRVALVNRLMRKAERLLKINPEQAEAYVVLIRGQKHRILHLLSRG